MKYQINTDTVIVCETLNFYSRYIGLSDGIVNLMVDRLKIKVSVIVRSGKRFTADQLGDTVNRMITVYLALSIKPCQDMAIIYRR